MKKDENNNSEEYKKGEDNISNKIIVNKSVFGSENNKNEENNKFGDIRKEDINNPKGNKNEEDNKFDEIKVDGINNSEENKNEENNKFCEIKKEETNNSEENKREEDNKPEEFNIIINSSNSEINPNKNLYNSSPNNNPDLTLKKYNSNNIISNTTNQIHNKEDNWMDKEKDKILEQSILHCYTKNSIEENEQNNKLILKEYKNTKTLKGHEKRVVSITILNSGYIATGSYDNSIKIWDISKKPENALIETRFSVGAILCLLELEPNILLAGNSENAIDIFDLNDESIDPYSRLFGHSLWVTALVKCDEKNFASSSNDAKIFIWDSEKKIKLRELVGHVDCILTMILLNNDNLCSGSADKTIRIWNWKNGNSLFYIKAHDNWVKILFQMNDDILLSGSDDKTIKIWDLNLRPLAILQGHDHSVRTFCKINDNYFASGSFDNKIKIWDLNEKKCIQTLEGHLSNIINIINYNGKIVSCSSDKTIKVWEEI